MVFGYQQGGSFSQHKQALGYDAATSEQMRLKHIAEQRKRDLQMRAKQDLQSKQVRLRIVKSEISRMESESRRLGANENKISDSRGHVENFDQKLRELKTKEGSINSEIADLQRKSDKLKISMRDVEREIQKITAEKTYAEKTAANHGREIITIQERKKREDAEIAKLKTEETHLEGEIRELERVARGV